MSRALELEAHGGRGIARGAATDIIWTVRYQTAESQWGVTIVAAIELQLYKKSKEEMKALMLIVYLSKLL